jgi:glycosyltransferase involved in cell wall biosynthesis
MRVLVVAYYFPPKGGAGTQRFAKFCKYLPDYGIEPVVLTVSEDEKSEHAPHDDASLAHGNGRVERVAEPRQASLRMRVRRALRLHVDADEWADAVCERALQLAAEQPFDAVVTTLSPYACYRVGERLQRALGIPWIADLRDPWALDAWRVYPSPLHARIDLARLKRTLTGADFVIANVPEAKRAFELLGAASGRCVVIPNGFDDEDFVGLPPPPHSADEQPFRLVHIGTFHPASLDAGMTRNTLRRVRNRQIQPLGRTGYYLLQAVAIWRDQVGADQAAQRLSVHLYGQVDESHRALMRELRIEQLFTMHGYVAHQKSVAALASADAVFVPLHDVAAGERALVVPGKLYEALASERPVLGALPPGDGADLIKAMQAGSVVPPTDARQLAQALGEMIAAHGKGEPQRGCDRVQLRAFSRRSLTGRLAAVLEAAVARTGALALPDLWSVPERP